MRRTPSTDTPYLPFSGGPAVETATDTTDRFEHAYRELASAREAYDRHLGDPDAVPNLAVAAERLAVARREMASLRIAA